jgi:hypothetical protein
MSDSTHEMNDYPPVFTSQARDHCGGILRVAMPVLKTNTLANFRSDDFSSRKK